MRVLEPPYWDDDYISSWIAVDGDPMTNWRLVSRVVASCAPGDQFLVASENQFRNDIGPIEYTVGIGLRIFWYRLEAGSETRLQVGKSSGMNVDNNVIHHLSRTIERLWIAPADWPAGHRVVFQLVADAHSTGWLRNGGDDRITIENSGHIRALRWTEVNA